MPRYPTGPKRPIDKENMFILSNSLGTSQDATTVRTSTVAETFSGGHIQISIGRVSGGGVVQVALVHIPEGASTPTLSSTDGDPLCNPEEYMLWGASVYVPTASIEPVIMKDRIKTMRKLKPGDTMRVLMKGGVATVANVTALLTSFYKQ